jgi:hypothetical protein
MGDGIMVEEHKIGIPELYSEVRVIGDKLTEYINRQDVQSTSLAHRVQELEKDLLDLKADRAAHEAEKRANSRQVWMATLTAFIFPLVLLGLGLLIAK